MLISVGAICAIVSSGCSKVPNKEQKESITEDRISSSEGDKIHLPEDTLEEIVVIGRREQLTFDIAILGKIE